MSMRHVGLTLLGAIGNSLIYSVVDRWAIILHVVVTLIGAIANGLL